MKIGILGAGGMGRHHAKRLGGIDGVEIVAVCDTSAEQRKALGDTLGLKSGALYDNFDTMLSSLHFDALYVCLPPFAHNGQVEKAASKGIHIFMEKPIALTIERAESMVKAIAQAGVVSQVGYHLRRMPAVKKIKQLIDDGTAGKVTAFIGTYQCNSLHSSWWRRRELCGGQIFEQVIHVYDLATYLLGTPVSVSAFMDNLCHRQIEDYTVEDTSAAIIRFKNGAIAGITASNCAVPGKWIPSCRLICEHFTAEDITGASTRIVSYVDGKVTGEETIDNTCDAVMDEDRYFIEAVNGRTAPQTTAAEGLLDIKVVTAAVRSAQNGAIPVQISSL